MAEILPVLADTATAAKRIKRPEGTVRRWAHEGRISAKAKDTHGRTLYEVGEITQLAEALEKFKRRGRRRTPALAPDQYQCGYCLNKQTQFPCPTCNPEIYIG